MPYTQEMFIRDHYPEWYQKIQSAKAEAKAEGEARGKLIGGILLCQRILRQPLYSQETLESKNIDELKRISAEFESRIKLI